LKLTNKTEDSHKKYRLDHAYQSMLAVPALVVLTATFLVAVPVVTRAVRIDPAMSLREE
jgi:Mg/Co/Ni transporter MgtE